MFLAHGLAKFGIQIENNVFVHCRFVRLLFGKRYRWQLHCNETNYNDCIAIGTSTSGLTCTQIRSNVKYKKKPIVWDFIINQKEKVPVQHERL